MKDRTKILIGWLVVIAVALGGFYYLNRTEEAEKILENKGTLSGSVTIGPVCTKKIKQEFPTLPCVPTPEMYAAAHVLVYMPDKTTLVTTIIPDKEGKFSISLLEGSYFIDMIKQRMGGTKGVPITIVISRDTPIVLKLEVDTGLR